MIAYRLVFHADAVTDYDEAYFWYEEQQRDLGERFLSAVTGKTQQILANPETFSAHNFDEDAKTQVVIKKFISAIA